MATVFVKWHCFVSCVNTVSSPEVTQRQLIPPPRDVLIPRAFYAANDQTHNVYLVLIPDDATATEGIYNPGVRNDNPSNDTRHDDMVDASGSGAAAGSNDRALTERVNCGPHCEHEGDELNRPEDERDDPVCTVQAHVSDTPGRSHSDDENVDSLYNRLSFVIPEENEDFVWL